MGGLRSSAQMISYELAMGASVIGVVMLAGTLDLNGIIYAQIRSPFKWFIIPQFIGFMVFLIAAFAETNRVPFDLPEAETELVAGFHTEYSALKFALFFMAEYVNMFTVSVMCTVLFLGGWYVPGLGHVFEPGSIPYALVSHVRFIGKICAFLFFYIWVRGTLPRFRFDQLMNFGWKFLLPVALANVILTIVIVFFLKGTQIAAASLTSDRLSDNMVIDRFIFLVCRFAIAVRSRWCITVIRCTVRSRWSASSSRCRAFT